MDLHSMHLIAAALLGFAVLLLLIIKCKLHAIYSVLIAAVVIGVASGMELSMVTTAVGDGIKNTLSSIALIVTLGSMFGGLLEVSGAAESIADSLVRFFGEKNSAFALGIAAILIGIPVFYDPAFIILMPICYSVAKRTNKSLVTFVLPMTAGLGIGSAIPPTPAPMLITGNLPVSLGTVTLLALLVMIPKYLIAYAVMIPFAKKYYVPVPERAAQVLAEREALPKRDLPPFGLVLCIIVLPILLILMNSSAQYLWQPATEGAIKIQEFLIFIGQPYLALIIANVLALILLCLRRGINMGTIEKVLNKSLNPVAMIIMVTAGGGVLRYMLDYSGLGTMIGNFMASVNMPVILVSFILATLMRICVGSTTVAMTMTMGIIASFPQLNSMQPMYVACIGMAAMFGATSFSHVNDSGFWLTKEYMDIDLKTAFSVWTLNGGIASVLSFLFLFAISFIWA